MIHRNRLVAAVDEELLLGLASGGGVYTYGLLSFVWRSAGAEFNEEAYDLMRKIMDEAEDSDADIGDYDEYDVMGSGFDALNRVAEVKAADIETLHPGFLFEEDRSKKTATSLSNCSTEIIEYSIRSPRKRLSYLERWKRSCITSSRKR